MIQTLPPRTRWFRIIGGGILLGLLGTLAGKLLFPASKPALVQDLSGDWDRRNRVLQQRVAAQFPAGSAEGALLTTLRNQGFEIGTSEAKWQRKDFPCKTFVRIGWQAPGGRIVRTEASIFQACP